MIAVKRWKCWTSPLTNMLDAVIPFRSIALVPTSVTCGLTNYICVSNYWIRVLYLRKRKILSGVGAWHQKTRILKWYFPSEGNGARCVRTQMAAEGHFTRIKGWTVPGVPQLMSRQDSFEAATLASPLKPPRKTQRCYSELIGFLAFGGGFGPAWKAQTLIGCSYLNLH